MKWYAPVLVVFSFLALLLGAGSWVFSLVHGHRLPAVRNAQAICYTDSMILRNDANEEVSQTDHYVNYTRRDGDSVRLVVPTDNPTGKLQKPAVWIDKYDSNHRMVEAFYDSETNMVFTNFTNHTLSPAPPSVSADFVATCIKYFSRSFGSDSPFSCSEVRAPMLGYHVLKMTYRSGVNHGIFATDVEDYRAPKLNWDSLLTVYRRPSDGRVYRRFEATQVQEGDPPDRLFHIPRTATIAPASKVLTEFNRVRGVKDCTRCTHPEHDSLFNTALPVY